MSDPRATFLAPVEYRQWRRFELQLAGAVQVQLKRGSDELAHRGRLFASCAAPPNRKVVGAVSTDNNPKQTEGVVRYADVVEFEGHAWVLAHDAENWSLECLKCGERKHFLTIPEMNKAIEHSYAYMPLKYLAPWYRPGEGEPKPAGYRLIPPCEKAGEPVPEVRLERGPVRAVATE